MEPNEKIAWIGLGNMGAAMAMNLFKAGCRLMVYNRSVEKAMPFKHKAQIAENLISTMNADIIFTMISNDQAVNEVFDIILAGDKPLSSKLFINMSTVSPDLNIRIGKELAERGASLIDAPVAGSIIPARDGNLIIMAGGAPEDIERADPYFSLLGKQTIYTGTLGTGASTKLAVNYYLSLIYLGLAEACAFASSMDLNLQSFLQVINESAAGSAASRIKTVNLLQADYTPAFSLDLMLKDILLARKSGANMPLSSALTQTYQEASTAGFGAEDVIGIIRHIQTRES